MIKKQAGFFLVAAFFLAQLALVSKSYAVPAFSRAHKVECTTCHTIAPELNEYGDAFLKNSYVYIGKSHKIEKKAAPTPAKATVISQKPATSQPISGEGDANKLSKLKAGALGADPTEAVESSAAPVVATADSTSEPMSEGLILSGVPEIIPISFTGSINYATGDKRSKSSTGGTNVDFAARAFKLHAAGNFRDTIGFFATYVAYSEMPPGGESNSASYNTSVTSSNNKTDINEFFLQWRNVLGTPVNLKFGRFQPKLGLWKTNNKLSVTNDYQPYSYTVGQNSAFKIQQAQDALELNAVLGNRFFLAGGVVNRKGQDNKESYGHLSYKFGGADYVGNEPDVDLNKEETILDFLTLTVGSYGYVGKNGSNIAGTPRNNFYRVGLDSELQYKIFRLRALFGYGVDDNATLNDPTMTLVRSKALTTEAEITLLTNLIVAGRFEFLQQEPKYVNSAFNDSYTRRYIATLGYTPLQNFKVSTEFKYEIGQSDIARIGTLGATFSF